MNVWWVDQDSWGELLSLCLVVGFMQGHVTLKDVFVYFSWEQWGLCEKTQKPVSQCSVFYALC